MRGVEFDVLRTRNRGGQRAALSGGVDMSFAPVTTSTGSAMPFTSSRRSAAFSASQFAA